MAVHVSKTVASCFAALRQIHSIQRSVSRPVLLSLVTSLVLSRLDYGSAALAGISKYLYWTVCSRSSMQQHVSLTEPASTTMCLHCFRNCIGFLFLNASNTGWPYVSLSVRHDCRVYGKRPLPATDAIQVNNA